MRCARKPTSVKQPKWHSLSTSSTACWRWDARVTSASYETTRTRDHCVHRLIHATRSRGAPVLADEGEEPVLDFVPLAGAGRQVVDHDIEVEFVGQLLQFPFPQPHPRAVAAAPIGGDQQSGRLGITRPP